MCVIEEHVREEANVFDVDVIATESGRVRWREADCQLRRIAKARARLDAEEVPWLLVAHREQVHLKLGFGSFAEYLERAVGYRRHTAMEKLRVAEALAGLPAIREALADGAISYSAVREITRVAKPHNEAEWLDRIDGKTVREIEEMVAGREPGDGPDDPQDVALEPRE